MTVQSRQFPLYPVRLLGVALAWNGLLLTDDLLLDLSYFGPFGLLACLGLACLCFTAPAGINPGRWLVRDQSFAKRWRWGFWYFGALSMLFAGLVAYRLVCTVFGLEPLL